ncbi:hypothetical protein QYE76_006258 [Lolium multiflorum]|uniref:Ribonuclease H n=1 Tax=Lolium multiflorum TaxID=4521 RepID=A0AAD8RVJ2_LOLMU|nr:hypothetical protein QYE76_006258 [Lolium multiflorum]
MRSLHDAVLMKEDLLLRDRNPSYPVLTAKVPSGFGFVTTYPADLMFIRYEDIFRLLNMQQLDRNLVRLLSLSMAHDIAMENTADIAIMDPFYMTPTVVQNEQAFLAKYIKDFLVLNKDKKCFAIPYFREFKYCTLLLFHPYHSHVSYLDSGLDPDKDFTDLKSTLDKALSGFIAEVGIDKIRHEKKVKGCYVCNHITKFPFLKQSAHDNGMEAWFAILQMRSIMTYYVVYHGRVPGVYEDWEDCRRQVHRFSGNSYKGYTTLEEAETRYANFRAGQRREMWRTPFIVMMLVATVSLVYYIVGMVSHHVAVLPSEEGRLILPAVLVVVHPLKLIKEWRTVNPYRFEKPTYTRADKAFWTNTQAALWEGFYDSHEYMKHGNIVSPKAINPDELVLHEATMYRFVVQTLKNLGLYDLVCLKPDDTQDDPTFCPLLVRQFHCTVFFHDDEDRTLTWMTGKTKYSCSYSQFRAAMGCGDDNPGYKIHSRSRLTRGDISFCYPANPSPGPPTISRMYYSYLVLAKLFRENLISKSGDHSEVRNYHLNLMYYCHPDRVRKIDGCDLM